MRARARPRSGAALPLTSALLTTVPAACTYGPPVRSLRLTSAVAKPDSHIFALAVHDRHWRWPTGLARFPDGGTPRMLEESAVVHVCDADERRITPEAGGRLVAVR